MKVEVRIPEPTKKNMCFLMRILNSWGPRGVDPIYVILYFCDRKKIFYYKGGPLQSSKTWRYFTPVTYLFAAIYRGSITPFITGCGKTHREGPR